LLLGFVLLVACTPEGAPGLDAGPAITVDAAGPWAPTEVPVARVCEVLMDLDGDATIEAGFRRSFAADGRELSYEQLTFGAEVHYRFDATLWNEAGQVLRAESVDASGALREIREATWRTDGRPLMDRYLRADGRTRTERRYAYDAAQHLSRIDVDDARTEFVHSSGGRGATRTHTAGVPPVRTEYQLRYDAAGLVESTEELLASGERACAEYTYATDRIVQTYLDCADRSTLGSRTFEWDPERRERTTTVNDPSGSYVSERWTAPSADRLEHVAYADRGSRVAQRTSFEGCAQPLGPLDSVARFYGEFVSAGVPLRRPGAP